MVTTSARLLKVLSLLQSKPFWSGAGLAEALGVTLRSVRRDVDRLRSLGYPVHAAAGTGGGYRLGAGKELPPLPLDDDEAMAVAIGLREAASGPVFGIEDAAVRALAKLEKVLPRRLRKRLHALQDVSVRLNQAGGPRVDAETLGRIANACREHELLSFDYIARGDEQSARTVEPYRLVHTSFRWYLLAYDLGRRDWRTFRVDRICARPLPRVSGRFAPRPLPSDDVAAYVSQAVSTNAYRYRARVTLHAPAEQVSKHLSGLAARVEPGAGDTCIIHTGADSLEALTWHLAFMGFDFEVHEPPELRDHLRRAAQRLSRAAAGAAPLRGPPAAHPETDAMTSGGQPGRRPARGARVR